MTKTKTNKKAIYVIAIILISILMLSSFYSNKSDTVVFAESPSVVTLPENLVDYDYVYTDDPVTGNYTFREMYDNASLNLFTWNVSSVFVDFDNVQKRKMIILFNSVPFNKPIEPDKTYSVGFIPKNNNVITVPSGFEDYLESKILNNLHDFYGNVFYNMKSGINQNYVFNEFYSDYSENVTTLNTFAGVVITIPLTSTNFDTSIFRSWLTSNYEFGVWECDSTTLYNLYAQDNYKKGYDLGYSQAYNVGYVKGLEDANNNSINVYNNGYNVGYTEGYNVGANDTASSSYTEGYNVGLSVGYSEGYNKGSTSSAQGFNGLMLVPATVLGQLFRTAFNWLNFSVLGINLWSIIVLMASFSLLILFFKLFFGR